MRNLFLLTFYEIRLLRVSTATYLAAFFFVVVMGIAFLAVIEETLHGTVGIHPVPQYLQGFILPALFLTPLLTMRTLAEEKRSGLLESLSMTPVSSHEVIISKFVAALLFYLVIYGLCFLFPLVTFWLTGDFSLIQVSHVLGSGLFILGTGCFFVAAGLFCSALSRSQFISAVFSFVLIFCLLMGSQAVSMLMEQRIQGGLDENFFQAFDFFAQANRYAYGLLDSRSMVFWLSGSAFFLTLSTLIIERRK